MSRTDFPPARGRAGLTVLLAAVFLAVIGASTGVAAGLYSKPDPSGSSDHDQCPGVTVSAAVNAGAKKPLSRVIYIRTVDDNGNDSSQVWICKDANGRLFYQGHSIQKGSLDAATSDHTLFLTTVERDGDGHRAINSDANGSTKYYVSTAQLKVITSRETWAERVTEHSP